MVYSKAEFDKKYSKSDVQKTVDVITNYVDTCLIGLTTSSEATRKHDYKKFHEKGIVVLYETGYYGDTSHLGHMLDWYFKGNDDNKQEVRDKVVQEYRNAGWDASWKQFTHNGFETGVLRIKLQLKF